MMKLFNTKNETYTSSDEGSRLFEGLTFKDGNLEGTGDITINCIFCGNIDINGEVTVESVGTLIGDIHAKSVTINGTVNGNVTVSENIIISNEGQLTGNVSCMTFEINGGGIFSGHCNMQTAEKNLVSFVHGKSSQMKPALAPSKSNTSQIKAMLEAEVAP